MPQGTNFIKIGNEIQMVSFKKQTTYQHILKYNICRSAEAINVLGICYNYKLLDQIDILPFVTPGEIQQEHITVSKRFTCLFDDSNQLMLSKISWHFYLHLQNMLSKLSLLTRTEMWQNCALIPTTLVVQYIPKNMYTVFALLCFVVVIHWLIFPYPSGLLHWHCGNLTIAPMPTKQPWWIWINTSCEFIMNDCITTTKQSTTKPCAFFLGYTVHFSTGKILHYAQFADKSSVWLILILHETSNIMIENSCNKIFLTLNLTYL